MNNMFFILCNCRYFYLVSFCLLGKESHPFYLVQKTLENNYHTSHTKAYVKDSWELCDQLVFHEIKLFSDIIHKISQKKKPQTINFSLWW